MPLQTAERLALQHQRDLATIAGATTSVVASVAMGADPATISTWYFGVVDGLLARIQAGHAQARLSSTQFLAKHAAMNGVDLTPVPASLNMERARTSLRVTGPVAFQTAMRAGQDEEQAIRSMATQMAGSSQRLVMAGDRDTFEQTLNAGKGIVGWRRRLAGKSCGFCAMLASRGAVYETRKSATQAKDGLAFHDHCNCWAEPMYKHETEPPEVQLLQRQWRNVTAGKRGGGAARAWRQHWEENVSPVERERLGMAAAKAAPSPIPGPPVPTPGVVVRSALDSKKTLSGLEQAWTAEARRITGRDLDVVIPAGTSLQTAKEYAEGVLRGMERFPDSALLKIRFGQMPGDHYAEAGQRMIVFNDRWSSIPNRPGLVAGTAHMVDDWPSRNIGWGVRGNGTTMSTAIHEFGHIIDTDTLGERIHARARAIVEREAAAEGIDVVDFVARDISVYATSDAQELIAEAFADVMLRGQAASPVAREIFDLLEAEYFRAGGRITPSFGTFPAKAAPVRALTPAEFEAAARRAKTEEAALEATESVDHALRRAQLTRGLPEPIRTRDRIRLTDVVYNRETGYAGGGYRGVNRGLQEARGGGLPDSIRAQVDDLDRVIRLGSLADDVVLYRGIARPELLTGGRALRAGDEFTEFGYGSTSVSREHAIDFARGRSTPLDELGGRPANPTVVRLVAPKGQQAIQISDLEFPGVGEVLLPRGMSYRVVADRGVVNGVRQLDVQIVPARPVAAAEVPNLAKMTVADLRALAKERGVTLPPKALKADIVRALEEGPSATPIEVRAAKLRAREMATDVEKVLPAASAEIRRFAEQQAAFAPRTFTSLRSIHVPKSGDELTELFRQKPGLNAYYSNKPARTFAAPQSELESITLNPVFFGSGRAEREALIREMHEMGYFTPSGAPDGLGYVLAHEYGHHVEAQFLGLAAEGASAEVNARLVQALIREFDLKDSNPFFRKRNPQFVPKAGVVAEADLNYLIIYNSDKIKEAVSGLASTNFHELLAEIWQEYSTLGTKARPAIRRIGRIIHDMAEESAAIRSGLVVAKRAVAPKPIVAATPNLSKLKVADLRTMAAERQIPIPAKATKAELVRLVQSTPDEIKALQQKAIRDAARERNRLIESSTGTARLLAEVDELISKGASKATILQRLDPKLVKPEQVFAGADPAIVDALRVAVESGDAAKLRTALTRAGTKAKVKPISKAGTKTKFDPATMESVGGEIADGAQVVVVTRGSTLTLPDGSTMQLAKAKVTAVPTKPIAVPKSARPSRDALTAREIMGRAQGVNFDAMSPAEQARYLAQMDRAVLDIVDGSFNGITVRLKKDGGASFSSQFIGISGDLMKDGRKVGTFYRTVSPDRATGQLVAHHSYLQLTRGTQGSGFAEEFNQNLFEWYRRSGIKRVELMANEDVGGYAWATKGFEFEDAAAATEFLDRARPLLDAALKRTPKGLTAAQVRELDAYIRDVEAGRVPARTLDIARFGRAPGQGGKDAIWAGKWLMLKNHWRGVLDL